MKGGGEAQYYDIISDPARRLAHEGKFLEWLLSASPGSRVVDMAAGTGVQAQFLAERGALVTARDIDEAMISYAREKRAHEHVMYEVADMRTAGGGPFDLEIVMGNSLGMLPDVEDVTKTFAAMAGMLVTGGVAFAHVINYKALEAGGPRQKVARKSTEGGEIVIVKDTVPTVAGGSVLVAFSYFERNGAAWETSGTQSTLLNLGKDEIESAAKAAGLEVKAFYGDYDRSAFSEKKSPDLLTVMVKS